MTTEIELMSISIGRGGISLSGGRGGYTWVPEFDLWDDFITTEAAPLASPRTAEPGPGTGTVVDTETKISISGSQAVFAGGKAVPAYGDPSYALDSISRARGRTMIASFSLPATDKHLRVGLSSADENNGEIIHFSDMGTITQRDPINLSLGVYSAGVVYDVACVCRLTSSYVLIRGGAFSDWTLLWLQLGGGNSGATLTPKIFNYNAAPSFSTFRVLDLPAPFNTDYGLATNRIAGAVSAGATFVHEADCLIEFAIGNTGATSRAVAEIRSEDSNNLWRINVTPTAFDLREVVAGVETTRATAAVTPAIGHRIVVIADGATIRGYYNNALSWTYASATDFQTETQGKENSGGTWSISDLIAWPRTLSGQAKTLLDAAIDA